MFGLFGDGIPFPVEEKPGGYRLWDRKEPPRARSWKPIIIMLSLFGFCCIGTTGSISVWAFFQGQASVMPTPEILTLAPVEITEESTAETTRESTEESTEEITAEITLEAYPSPTASLRVILNDSASTQSRAATYTPYPTYTNAPPVIVEQTSPPQRVVVTRPVQPPPQQVVITSPPIVQPIEIIVTSIQVVTATPTFTPSFTPSPTLTSTATHTPTFTPSPTLAEITPEATETLP